MSKKLSYIKCLVFSLRELTELQRSLYVLESCLVPTKKLEQFFVYKELQTTEKKNKSGPTKISRT